jgi:hemerythrin superfamily protein
MEDRMDALDALTADHNRVRGLFDRFEEAEEADDAATMAEVFVKMHEDLEVHTTIEEEIFYPWARGLSDEVNDLIDEGIQEHHVAKVLLGEIEGLEPGADAWKAKVKVLIEAVEHHAEEEEKEMFPKIRGASSADDREQVGQQLEARKAQLGAPTPADAEGMTKEQLIDLASEQHIPGRSKMDRDELAATVDAR